MSSSTTKDGLDKIQEIIQEFIKPDSEYINETPVLQAIVGFASSEKYIMETSIIVPAPNRDDCDLAKLIEVMFAIRQGLCHSISVRIGKYYNLTTICKSLNEIGIANHIPEFCSSTIYEVIAGNIVRHIIGICNLTNDQQVELLDALNLLPQYQATWKNRKSEQTMFGIAIICVVAVTAWVALTSLHYQGTVSFYGIKNSEAFLGCAIAALAACAIAVIVTGYRLFREDTTFKVCQDLFYNDESIPDQTYGITQILDCDTCDICTMLKGDVELEALTAQHLAHLTQQFA